MMKLPSRAKFREELKEISRIIDAPDSRPGKHMRATRENESPNWNEQEDTRRCDANLQAYLEDFDEATKRLASPRS